MRVVHSAPGGQHVVPLYGAAAHHGVEHLRQLRVLLAEEGPHVTVVVLTDHVACYQFT